MNKDRNNKHESQYVLANQPYAPQDDEIDLLDLVRVLVARRNLIAGITAFCVLVALCYVFVAPRTYEATSVVIAPRQRDIQVLRIPGVNTPDYQQFKSARGIIPLETLQALGIMPPNVDQVYDLLKKNLSSLSLRRQVYTELVAKRSQLSADHDANKEALFKGFTHNYAIAYSGPKKGDESITTISMQGTDPKEIAVAVNRLVALADQQTLVNLKDTILAQAETLAVDIRKKITMLQAQTIQLRQDEITRLLEADSLARQELESQILALRTKAKNERLALVCRLEADNNIAKQKITTQIAILRSNAHLRRQDQIAQLSAMLSIAEDLGIVDPFDKGKYNRQDDQNDFLSLQPMVVTEVNTFTPPLYLRGSKALTAEIAVLKTRKVDDPFIGKLRGLQEKLDQLENDTTIEALKSRQSDDPYISELPELKKKLTLLKENNKVKILHARKSDDPFLTGLREMQGQYERLESLDLEGVNFSTGIVDEIATPPEFAIKPKRRLVMALSVVLGLCIGVMAAFAVNLVTTIKEDD